MAARRRGDSPQALGENRWAKQTRVSVVAGASPGDKSWHWHRANTDEPAMKAKVLRNGDLTTTRDRRGDRQG
ncbi:hypothetical protein ACCO45_004368 [Purpureocillium lilacinum]|uniref:Uncharacterized protein n=1 Tax=Purpureocillium lilacinum TaxID=33203 RepID=A0ACC4E2J4_PURLI